MRSRRPFNAHFSSLISDSIIATALQMAYSLICARPSFYDRPTQKTEQTPETLMTMTTRISNQSQHLQIDRQQYTTMTCKRRLWSPPKSAINNDGIETSPSKNSIPFSYFLYSVTSLPLFSPSSSPSPVLYSIFSLLTLSIFHA